MTKAANTLFRLTDLQLVLLTSAAQRPDGSLLPPPDSIGGQAVRIRKAILPLIKHALVNESPATLPTAAWRQDGDAAIGVFITDAGRHAIGDPEALTEVAANDEPAAAEPQPTIVGEPSAKKVSKAAQVLGMLQREGGATLDELVTATGWLPHTTRAALTGLRKKGHAIERSKRGEATCYSVAA